MAYHAVQRLAKKLNKVKKNDEIVEMGELFRHLTLHVITGAILSLSADESDQTFAHMYLPIVEEGNYRVWSPQRMFLPTFSWFKFRRDVRNLNDYVTDLIEKRHNLREAEAKLGEGAVTRKQDILDIVLSAIKPEEWGLETIRQIRDEVKTFILAGHETSASMLTWTLFELTCNPILMMKARREAETVFGVKTKDPGLLETVLAKRLQQEQLRGLSFVQSCLLESLRKYSVVPSVVRVASEDTDIGGGLWVTKGTTLMLNIQGVHHNPAFWPEPLKYDPDRFASDREIQPYTFLPFIDGPRQCLGQNLSLLETKMVLALLILMFDFELTDPAAAGQKHPYMVPIIPKNGHFMRII